MSYAAQQQQSYVSSNWRVTTYVRGPFREPPSNIKSRFYVFVLNPTVGITFVAWRSFSSVPIVCNRCHQCRVLLNASELLCSSISHLRLAIPTFIFMFVGDQPPVCSFHCLFMVSSAARRSRISGSEDLAFKREDTVTILGFRVLMYLVRSHALS